MGTLEPEKPCKRTTGYGNILKMGTCEMRREGKGSSRLNCTVNRLSRRIQCLVGDRKEQGESVGKKNTVKRLHFSEACQELETDVSIPLKNTGHYVNSTMDSRNAKCISLHTSEGLTTAYGNIKNYGRTPHSKGSSSKMGRAPSTLQRREQRKCSHQNNPRLRLETEEDSFEFSAQPTEENNSVLLNDTRVKKFRRQSNDKLETTAKRPIQSLLRPITVKDRCYQQRMKGQEERGKEKCVVF